MVEIMFCNANTHTHTEDDYMNISFKCLTNPGEDNYNAIIKVNYFYATRLLSNSFTHQFHLWLKQLNSIIQSSSSQG